MLKDLYKLARGFYGIWAELRKIRELIEWGYWNGLDGKITGDIQASGVVNIQIHVNPIGLVPTKAEIKSAEKEEYEWNQLPNEEQRAADEYIRLMKLRAKGESEDELPGAGYKGPL